MSDRPVATDALATLGTIIGEGEKRDAIHLAVAPVVALEKLFPGQDVGADGSTANPVGIVDPFLKTPVFPGQRFWLVIYPRVINSLRHVWTHSAFEDEAGTPARVPQAVVTSQKDESVAWIRSYADRIDLTYNRLMAGADDWVASKEGSQWGEYLVDGGNLEGVSTDPKFWDHYCIVREKEVPAKARENFFSCSC